MIGAHGGTIILTTTQIKVRIWLYKGYREITRGKIGRDKIEVIVEGFFIILILTSKPESKLTTVRGEGFDDGVAFGVFCCGSRACMRNPDFRLWTSRP